MQLLNAQQDARLFRFPDVSANQIVFSYANDLWLANKTGGQAQKLSSPAGVEFFPKFSIDGSKIAYSANYNGNPEIYTIAVTGGIPNRLTYHGEADRVIDWSLNGEEIIFASNRESEKDRFNKLFTISQQGGLPKTLPFPFGEFASYSPDGKNIAVVFRSEIFRNWKRYRGGDVADIYIYNFDTKSSINISEDINAGEEMPMWYQNTIYFISDNGAEKRMNLWAYHVDTKQREQITFYKDNDVHFPSLGPSDIIFEAEGKLHLYDLKNKKLNDISIQIISDYNAMIPKTISASKTIQTLNPSPDGNRVIIQARGDLFSVPAENGSIVNLTQTSDYAERYPSWSPDGLKIAYWSDQSGEYELWIADPKSPKSAKKITSYGAGFRYNIFWSPDSKKLAFIDKAAIINIFDLTNNQTTFVDKGLSLTHGALELFSCSWSPDSKWLTYHRDLDNYNNAIFLFDLTNKKLHQITTGYYECNSPVFDKNGKYIYLFTKQSFQPLYSDLDNTFIYPNATLIGAIALKKSTPGLLAEKEDTVAISITEEKESLDKKKKNNDEPSKDIKKTNVTEIDIDGIESRLVLLPIKAGNYSTLRTSTDKILYLKLPLTGSGPDVKTQLAFFDIIKKEEKIIIDEIGNYELSFDGQKILAIKPDAYAIIKPEESQKMEKMLRVSDMEMFVNPKSEWKQILTDVWRIERDYFYDEKMHGVDWNKVKTNYFNLLESANSREDVNFIIGEMIAELNASHTYRYGGDLETPLKKNVGYLGIDWEVDGEHYRIKKIIKPADWDAEVRSPLDQANLGIKAGDYIHSINGIKISTNREPSAYLQGLANKTIELEFSSSNTAQNVKRILIKTMDSEARLRNLAWIETNRQKVAKATNNEVAYIYVPSTGTDGQTELIRQFAAQWDKKAIIIDERFNNGGQIPDRFVELLNREPLAFWAVRDGKTWPWPPYANFGPKVMLINGWSGSGGDAFPDFFRKKKIGPLIGARTWGGLIGISGVPDLIDGGGITAPTFRMYNVDGTWFKEGHGVDPDIEVKEDLGALSQGIDTQLDRAILEIKQLLKQKAFIQAPRPPAEIR